jgi:SAM-dependent methyltransferase
MIVLEPGPGMGFFTLELARLVGPRGRVIAVDVQARMLAGLKRRAAKAGLLSRIDARLAAPDSLGIADLSQVDFVLAFAVVHELAAPESFFVEAARALKPGGMLLLAEPTGHVKAASFEQEMQVAARAGLPATAHPCIRRCHAALLAKP